MPEPGRRSRPNGKGSPPRTVSVDRTFDASLEVVWELCTTKGGIESWWGPDGFTVTVQTLELRPGGVLEYTMEATDPAMIEGLRSMGVPVSTSARLRFQEVTPPRRLVYAHQVDFVPGVPTYEVVHTFELEKVAKGVRLVVSFERMHDEEWTGRATLGWTQELAKLGRVLETHRAGRRPVAVRPRRPS
jgi:uncharacterized protein YndB with AHSA1/START domain